MAQHHSNHPSQLYSPRHIHPLAPAAFRTPHRHAHLHRRTHGSRDCRDAVPQVQVPVQSAEQLYDVYAAIGRDPRVKFKF